MEEETLEQNSSLYVDRTTLAYCHVISWIKNVMAPFLFLLFRVLSFQCSKCMLCSRLSVCIWYSPFSFHDNSLLFPSLFRKRNSTTRTRSSSSYMDAEDESFISSFFSPVPMDDSGGSSWKERRCEHTNFKNNGSCKRVKMREQRTWDDGGTEKQEKMEQHESPLMRERELSPLFSVWDFVTRRGHTWKVKEGEIEGGTSKIHKRRRNKKERPKRKTKSGREERGQSKKVGSNQKENGKDNLEDISRSQWQIQTVSLSCEKTQFSKRDKHSKGVGGLEGTHQENETKWSRRSSDSIGRE